VARVQALQQRVLLEQVLQQALLRMVSILLVPLQQVRAGLLLHLPEILLHQTRQHLKPPRTPRCLLQQVQVAEHLNHLASRNHRDDDLAHSQSLSYQCQRPLHQIFLRFRPGENALLWVQSLAWPATRCRVGNRSQATAWSRAANFAFWSKIRR